MQPTRTAKRAAVDFYAAVADGELETALAVLGGDVRWFEAPGMPYEGAGGEPYRGAAEVAEHVLAPITADVDGLRLDDLQVTELGNAAVVHGVYRGTGHRTGQKIEQPFVHVWLVDGEGSVVEFRQFTDTGLFRDAAGLS